jgi:hypothetical protein
MAPPRKTMIKDTVGHVRRCAYDLPNTNNGGHTFGKAVPRDNEGAGQVLQKWVGPELSSASENSRSFVETNRRAVNDRALTAKDFRSFANEHKNIRSKPPQGRSNQDSSEQFGNMVFGQQTVPSDSSISGLIQADYTSFEDDSTDYPDTGGMQQRGRLPAPRGTKASRGQDVRTEGTSGQAKAPTTKAQPFKMKKFANMESRV